MFCSRNVEQYGLKLSEVRFSSTLRGCGLYNAEIICDLAETIHNSFSEPFQNIDDFSIRQQRSGYKFEKMGALSRDDSLVVE